MAADRPHRLDYDRLSRIGISEAIYCETKTDEQIVAIAQEIGNRAGRALFTRLSAEKSKAIEAALGGNFDYEPLSKTGILGQQVNPADLAEAGKVWIVLGGTSDLGVAIEAERTLAFHGIASSRLTDVGVAGLHRLLEHADRLSEASVVIVVAGLEAALPSVVAGLLRAAIIAIPTSVGYGVSAGGKAALYSCLASCAPGIAVVNIDNGFGGAAVAIRILNAQRRPFGPKKDS